MARCELRRCHSKLPRSAVPATGQHALQWLSIKQLRFTPHGCASCRRRIGRHSSVVGCSALTSERPAAWEDVWEGGWRWKNHQIRCECGRVITWGLIESSIQCGDVLVGSISSGRTLSSWTILRNERCKQGRSCQPVRRICSERKCRQMTRN
jgi:hypothetical protein